ncbi:MAG TPA: penicillin acylase family protein [Solirubrobacteraceae bacterium]
MLAVVGAVVLGGAIGDALASGHARRARHPALYSVIRRTEGGFPHIEARNWRGLGYGFGYAFAQDDLCTMADDYVTVDAQRSRYFGPNGSYPQPGNGTTPNNLDSDLYWKQIIDSHVVNKLLSVRRGVGALSPALRQGVQGYVDGYNRYLKSVGGSRGVPDRRCRGKPWVHPITTADAYRRFYQLVELASGDVVLDGIAQAQPPTPSVPVRSTGQLAHPKGMGRVLSARLHALHAGGVGSNAVAIGSAGTRNHHGLLLGNPHFAWTGDERFYEFQYTIPGKINVSGMTLFGVPIVLIGHTMSMAWSHTVSTAFRFTPYELTLVPGDPTSYLENGKPVKMTSRRVTVDVRQRGGLLRPYSRTLYSTRYGPVMNSLAGIPLPWTSATAFTMRDANADNFRIFNHFFYTDMAQSAQQEYRILKKYEGIPWVNTIVSDRGGHALYADIGAIPHVTNAEAQRCDTALGAVTFADVGLPILDGSRTSCDWGTDPDSADRGLFGASHEPHLFRSDYVTNSNDSYWLSNPHHPLTGFARVIGTENTARSLRTRIGLIETDARVHGHDHLGPPGFTLRQMQNMDLGDLSYSGVLTRDDLVAMCRQFQSAGGEAPTSSGPPVPIANACHVLATWDLHANLKSRGELLFRQFWAHASGATQLWSHPYSSSDPVHTPYGLNTSDPAVRTALGDAIEDLDGAHIPLGAPVGSRQYVRTPSGRIPIHGGPADPNGIFNAIYPTFTAGAGYGPIWLGSSFIQVVTWGKRRCPVARNILTYSESDNPDSPHHFDQTRLFSKKRWLVDRFCSSSILASPGLQTTVLDGPRIIRPSRPDRRRPQGSAQVPFHPPAK